LQASLTPEFTRMTWGDIPGKVPEGIEVDGQRITAEFVVAPAQNRRVEVDDHLTVFGSGFFLVPAGGGRLAPTSAIARSHIHPPWSFFQGRRGGALSRGTIN
jgi:hypothetical protein